MTVTGPDEERLCPLRAGKKVIRDRVTGHTSAEQTLDLGVDRLHTHLRGRLREDGHDCTADRPELAALRPPRWANPSVAWAASPAKKQRRLRCGTTVC